MTMAAVVRVARGALSGLFFVIWGLFAFPFALLLPLPVWPKPLVRALLRACFRLFVFLARITWLFRVECTADDQASLRALRGRVIVMNHVSMVDPVLIVVSDWSVSSIIWCKWSYCFSMKWSSLPLYFREMVRAMLKQASPIDSNSDTSRNMARILPFVSSDK